MKLLLFVCQHILFLVDEVTLRPYSNEHGNAERFFKMDFDFFFGLVQQRYLFHAVLIRRIDGL